MRTESLIKELDELRAGEMDELATLLRDRAERRRNRVSVDEVRAIAASVELSPGWESSLLRPVGALRAATRHLLQRGWHPEQIIGPLVAVGSESIDDLGVIELAIALEIRAWKASAA